MAQEVQKVLPQAILGTKDKMAVNYNALVPLLIEGIKELHSKVDAKDS